MKFWRAAQLMVVVVLAASFVLTVGTVGLAAEKDFTVDESENAGGEFKSVGESDKVDIDVDPIHIGGTGK